MDDNRATLAKIFDLIRPRCQSFGDRGTAETMEGLIAVTIDGSADLYTLRWKADLAVSLFGIYSKHLPVESSDSKDEVLRLMDLLTGEAGAVPDLDYDG